VNEPRLKDLVVLPAVGSCRISRRTSTAARSPSRSASCSGHGFEVAGATDIELDHIEPALVRLAFPFLHDVVARMTKRSPLQTYHLHRRPGAQLRLPQGQ